MFWYTKERVAEFFSCLHPVGFWYGETKNRSLSHLMSKSGWHIGMGEKKTCQLSYVTSIQFVARYGNQKWVIGLVRV